MKKKKKLFVNHDKREIDSYLKRLNHLFQKKKCFKIKRKMYVNAAIIIAHRFAFANVFLENTNNFCFPIKSKAKQEKILNFLYNLNVPISNQKLKKVKNTKSLSERSHLQYFSFFSFIVDYVRPDLYCVPLDRDNRHL